MYLGNRPSTGTHRKMETSVSDHFKCFLQEKNIPIHLRSQNTGTTTAVSHDQNDYSIHSSRVDYKTNAFMYRIAKKLSLELMSIE
jgi:hypothetical protein